MDFLKEIQAYDEIYPVWLQRIMFYPDKMQHPMYHILLICFLAGSTQNFFEGYCPETLPYGKGPWPCRNKVCEYHLKDVIENIDIKYLYSFIGEVEATGRVAICTDDMKAAAEVLKNKGVQISAPDEIQVIIMEKKQCILYDGKTCDNCGECNMCDLDPKKVCDSCGACLDMDDDYNTLDIDLVMEDNDDPEMLSYEELFPDEAFGGDRQGWEDEDDED